jgi:hypothetical protein
MGGSSTANSSIVKSPAFHRPADNGNTVAEAIGSTAGGKLGVQFIRLKRNSHY